MAIYQYSALDEAGGKQRGVIEADSPKLARQTLRNRGLTPLTIDLASGTLSKKMGALLKLSRPPKKIRLLELSLVTRQLASLLAAGIPLEESLRAISEQSEQDRVSHLMLAIRSRVLEGLAFSQALAEFPQNFPKLYIAAIHAGENSGHLDLILEELATYLERQQQIRDKVQQALVYPVVVTSVCMMIVIFLLMYVVPKMVAVFTNMDQKLPLVTTVLLDISNFIKTDGLYALLALLLICYGIKRLLARATVRQRCDQWLLKLPMLGRLQALLNTGRFARTLGMLLTAGVPLLEAMSIAVGLIQNHVLQTALEKARADVREGGSLHNALRKTSYFPAMSLHLIASGEASGTLAAMLERAAVDQERDINRYIDLCLTLFEPVMILGMGAVILFIVLAVLLPIFSMDQLVSLQ